MTDYELLQLAAKAAGIPSSEILPYTNDWGGIEDAEWNPFIDDGDTWRLAVATGIDIVFFGDFARVSKRVNDILTFTHVIDAKANIELLRRAVVIAAAEVGKSMP